MSSILLAASCLGSRALAGALGARCSAALAGAPLQASSSTFFHSSSDIASGGVRAVHISASSSPDTAPSSSTALASTSSAPLDLREQRHLHLDGTRTADPGEPRYTAPFWVPPAARAGIPNILFSDPWPAHEEPQLRRQHAALCLETLRRSDRPLTAEQVRDAVNASASDAVSTSNDADALNNAAAAAAPVLSTLAYTKQLLEHLRRTRFVYGRKNPDSVLSPGHPDHPRLYEALAFQAARYGKPEALAAADEAARAAAIAKAQRRLRNGKVPYPQHRRRARFSIWQHELAQEALRELQAK
ncbi:hypothetical protein HYH02_005518 [Chlamydomonas schloesseri]|uniref:Uncharacterized protein n=1 Tax=Chlamydomonas schloesseri TaxID=2026947 RepID=A0A835WKY2_9CHLO|nr:hypothetical protein HYH02_005518 [Chlamydomonas schloesseri]|eukprot:KAG2449365.1 hypothetical protein HYH02_005518 [Chlamydomonas schloesseri]